MRKSPDRFPCLRFASPCIRDMFAHFPYALTNIGMSLLARRVP